METSMIIELAGYIGSALVVISMLMSSVVKLRAINTVGCVISFTYAMITHAYPIALMNFCLIIINVYNLRKLLKNTEEYDFIDAGKEEGLVNYFLEYYKEDMKQYFPDFDKNNFHGNTAYVVCCKACPAGILLGEKTEDGKLQIKLDYTTPAYRDCSVGKYLYSQLTTKGINQLVFTEKTNNHEAYLEKMGYTKTENGYVKKMS